MWLSSDVERRAVLFEKDTMLETDVRYYAVWRVPRGARCALGVHGAVGAEAYHGIIQACGGFSGGLKWKRCEDLEAALEKYRAEAARAAMPRAAAFTAWP